MKAFSKTTSRFLKFMYVLSFHRVPTTWRSRKQVSMRAEYFNFSKKRRLETCYFKTAARLLYCVLACEYPAAETTVFFIIPLSDISLLYL